MLREDTRDTRIISTELLNLTCSLSKTTGYSSDSLRRLQTAFEITHSLLSNNSLLCPPIRNFISKTSKYFLLLFLLFGLKSRKSNISNSVY
jgi:hypothetical protein